MSREDIILITDTKTNICRSFAITNPNWVETVKKYMDVRLIGINKIDKYLNLDCPMDTRLKFLK
jgi:hypothetical protein